MTSPSPPRVLWLQVSGLASVQGAIALTWVVYNLYLTALLTQFGFPGSLATAILVIENLLSAVMEPLMGSLSDRTQRFVGTRFPFISIGVVFSSALFIGIPAFFVFGHNLSGLWRWGLPILLIAWALAMSVFRSPAMSLLGRYAFASQLPQAASILTLVCGLAGSTAPLANQFILGLGPAVTFTIGSITLLGAAAALRAVNPQASITDSQPKVSSMDAASIPESSTPESNTPESNTPESSTPESSTPESSTPESSAPESSTLETPSDLSESTSPRDQPEPGLASKPGLEAIPEPAPELSPEPKKLSLPLLGLIFGAGVGVAIGFRILMTTFPAVLKGQVTGVNPGFIMGLIFLSIAVTAIPMGTIAMRLGNRRAMLLGLLVMAEGLLLINLTHNPILAGVIAIGLGTAFSLVSNGTIPFALALVPSEKAGLGTGMYFSGGAIGSSLFFGLLGNALPPAIGAMIGAAAFVGAGGCVAASRRFLSRI